MAELAPFPSCNNPAPRGGFRLAVLLVLPLGLAACGGGAGAAKLARPASTSATMATSPASATTSAVSAASGSPFDEFAACMRAHGVSQFPDPTDRGTTLRIGPVNGVDPNSPQYQAARATCGSLLPAGVGVGVTITPADQLDYLKAAACMRAHGFADFPDPKITQAGVRFEPPADMSPNSPQVQTALSICRKLIPAGLPYSS
jgi:hypothetical protein